MPARPYRGIHPKLAPGVYIDPAAVVIGDVELGADASIWPMAVVRGDVNYIRIGARSNVQDGSVLHVTRPYPGSEAGWPLLIGEDVVIGHNVTVHGCTIGNRVLVGIGAVVLDGAVVEDDVMIGAGSVVTPGKRLSSGGLYLGNPARRARELTAAEIARIPVMAGFYVDLKRDYERRACAAPRARARCRVAPRATAERPRRPVRPAFPSPARRGAHRGASPR
jgi:carbonic anhydrase/acetyltransferase-like protein (isoleucine patch superfamily)